MDIRQLSFFTNYQNSLKNDIIVGIDISHLFH